MKAIKRLTALVIMLCILLSALPVTASAEIASGSCGYFMDWTLNDNGTLSISGTYKMFDFELGLAPWSDYSEHIKKVVVDISDRIGTAAFSLCYNLTSVSLGEFVNVIGPYAFYGCTNLKSIPLRKVNNIGDYAFALSGLTSITIPSNVSSIGQLPFLGCSNLNKITVEQNNNYFSSDSSGVLFNKDKTELIQAPGGLTGTYTIPSSVKTIRAGAFALCEKVNEIIIPSSVTSIGDSAFEACSGLKRITVAGNNGHYSSDSSGVLFNKNKTELIQAPCALTGKYTVPGTVQYIRSLAFELCGNLTNITIPGSVTEIGANAFYYCQKLETVTIQNGVSNIDDSAFAFCRSLKNLSLPVSLTRIGAYAFSECSALKTLTIPDSVISIEEGAFSYCTGLTSVRIESGSVGEYAFYACEKMDTVKIGEGVECIYSQAFAYCSNLTNIAIPKSLSDIKKETFLECSKLTTVFYAGTSTERNDIIIRSYNSEISNAIWHYECVELQGKYGAYYCGECDKCYFLDGSESHFTDVLTDNWQFTHAKYAVEHNLMAGTGTDAYGRVTFLPDNAITREEFVQVLYNAENKPAVESEKVFPDVADDGWYKNAVLWAFENNIASGLGDGSFGIGRKITRQDLALMLYKYAALKGYSVNATTDIILQYGDGSIVSDYAKTAMDWAVTNGILSGKGTAGKPLSTFRLDPAGTASRAECAAMLRNFMLKFNT